MTFIFDLLDDASAPEQMDIRGPLLASAERPRKGERAISVSGNWRNSFHFEGEDATDVTFEKYH